MIFVFRTLALRAQINELRSSAFPHHITSATAGLQSPLPSAYTSNCWWCFMSPQINIFSLNPAPVSDNPVLQQKPPDSSVEVVAEIQVEEPTKPLVAVPQYRLQFTKRFQSYQEAAPRWARFSSAANKLVVCDSEGTIVLYATDAPWSQVGEVQRFALGARTVDFAFSCDGSQFALASESSELWIGRVSERSLVAKVQAHLPVNSPGDHLVCMVFSSKAQSSGAGNVLYVGTKEGKVFSLTEGLGVPSLLLNSEPSTSVSVLRQNGKRLFVAWQSGRQVLAGIDSLHTSTVRAWELTRPAADSGVYCISGDFSGEGKFAGLFSDGSLTVWRLRAGEEGTVEFSQLNFPDFYPDHVAFGSLGVDKVLLWKNRAASLGVCSLDSLGSGNFVLAKHNGESVLAAFGESEIDMAECCRSSSSFWFIVEFSQDPAAVTIWEVAVNEE